MVNVGFLGAPSLEEMMAVILNDASENVVEGVPRTFMIESARVEYMIEAVRQDEQWTITRVRAETIG